MSGKMSGKPLRVVVADSNTLVVNAISGLSALGCFEKQWLGLVLVSVYDKIREGQ